MEIVVQLVKHLPPGWPRVAVLLALALLFFFPDMRRLLTHAGTGKRRLDRAKHMLEVRKLELDVAALKANNPEAEGSILDAQIEKILSKPMDEEEQADPLAWSDRAKLALAGSVSWIVISTLALGLMGKAHGVELVHVALVELIVAVPAGLIASAIPSRTRWICVFRGFLIPALVGVLAVVAHVRG